MTLEIHLFAKRWGIETKERKPTREEQITEMQRMLFSFWLWHSFSSIINKRFDGFGTLFFFLSFSVFFFLTTFLLPYISVIVIINTSKVVSRKKSADSLTAVYTSRLEITVQKTSKRSKNSKIHFVFVTSFKLNSCWGWNNDNKSGCNDDTMMRLEKRNSITGKYNKSQNSILAC